MSDTLYLIRTRKNKISEQTYFYMLRFLALQQGNQYPFIVVMDWKSVPSVSSEGGVWIFRLLFFVYGFFIHISGFLLKSSTRAIILVSYFSGAYSCLYGQTWQAQSSNSFDSFHSISMWDSQSGWVFGESGAIFRTVDGGQNWLDQRFSFNLNIEGSFLFGKDSVLAVGEHEITGGGFVIRSFDGGQSWVGDSTSFSERLHDVHFANPQIGWAVGRDGYLVHTTDGGQNWQAQSSGTIERLFSVYFTDLQTGWAAGKDGTLLKTVNGGQSWLSVNTGEDRDFEDVFFLDQQRGWIVGEEGLILHTNNGGSNWLPQVSSSIADFLAIEMVDALTGWIGGTSGLVLHTIDGGSSWAVQNSAASSDVTDISMLTPQLGWLCSDLGQISRYGLGNGGIVSAGFSTQLDICLGDSLLFVSQSFGPIINWFWDLGDGHTANGEQLLYLYEAAGTYPVTLYVDDGNGHIDSFQQQIQVHAPQLNLDPASAFICQAGDTTVLRANGAIDYQWSPFHSLSSASGAQVLAFPDQSTTYTIVGLDAFGCTDTSYITVGIDTSSTAPIADFFASDTLLCQPGMVQFFHNSPNAHGYRWVFPGTLPGISTEPFPTVQFHDSGRYDVMFIAQGCAGEDTFMQNNHIKVLQENFADFSISTDTLYLWQGNQVSFLNASPHIDQWQWDFGNGLTDSISSPSTIYQQAGSHVVSLIASAGHCVDTMSRSILVLGKTALRDSIAQQILTLTINKSTQALVLQWASPPLQPFQVRLYSLGGREILVSSMSKDANRTMPLFPSAPPILLVEILFESGLIYRKKIFNPMTVN